MSTEELLTWYENRATKAEHEVKTYVEELRTLRAENAELRAKLAATYPDGWEIVGNWDEVRIVGQVSGDSFFAYLPDDLRVFRRKGGTHESA